MKSPREVLEKLVFRTKEDYIPEKLGFEASPDKIDQALSDLSEIVMAQQKPITQSYDDFDNGYETGWRSAITDIASLFTDKEQAK